MNQSELERYINQTYHADVDRPWMKYPSYKVFRHAANRKWFALIMDVQKDKLGLSETGVIDIVNLKCDPILVGTLRNYIGIFPAYHMNKDNWISVALDGSVPEDKVRMLLDISYELTAPKSKRKTRTG